MGQFSSKMTKGRPLQSIAIVIGPCWTNFCSHIYILNLWFPQDGAKCHTAEATLDDLRTVFEDNIIGRDLTPLDYYLYCAVKNKCYADKPETVGALKDNIREAMGELQLHTIDNVLKN